MTLNDLFATEVEVATVIRVVLGRGDDAQIHEFPATDVLQEDDDMATIADDTLKDRVEWWLADFIEEGELTNHKVTRPATGNIVISAPNVYGHEYDEFIRAEQQRHGQIENAMSRVNCEASTVLNLVQKLYGHLEPVLNPHPKLRPSENATAREPENMAPLAVELSGICNTLREATDTLKDIEEALEL